MRRALLALSLLAFGCAYEIPGDEFRAAERYPDEIETAIAEWSAAYGLTCNASELRAVVTGGDAFAELCGECGPEIKGCHSIAPRPTRHVLVIRDTWAHEDRNTITHEAMHWLAECSGAFPDADREHAAREVWDHEGGILARVNSELGMPHDAVLP